jgi:hypothetical protein
MQINKNATKYAGKYLKKYAEYAKPYAKYVISRGKNYFRPGRNMQNV